MKRLGETVSLLQPSGDKDKHSFIRASITHLFHADVTVILPVSDLRRISKEKEALQFDLEEHRNQTATMKNKINEFEAEHLKLNKVSSSPSQPVAISCQCPIMHVGCCHWKPAAFGATHSLAVAWLWLVQAPSHGATQFLILVGGGSYRYPLPLRCHWVSGCSGACRPSSPAAAQYLVVVATTRDVSFGTGRPVRAWNSGPDGPGAIPGSGLPDFCGPGSYVSTGWPI